MDEVTLFALLGAIFGGAGLKIVEWVLKRGERRETTRAELREELRNDVQHLREVLQRVEKDLDNWKVRYYNLLQAYNELKYVLLRAGVDIDEIPHINLLDIPDDE